ncbi:MAG: hypothetical protein ACK5UE_10975, partial [Chitinophagales bacterium]
MSCNKDCANCGCIDDKPMIERITDKYQKLGQNPDVHMEDCETPLLPKTMLAVRNTCLPRVFG